jgi:cytoskeletal protein CcmA (bactofilin family)
MENWARKEELSPDHHVPRGTTGRLDRIEGELKVGHGARIVAQSGNLVSVSGSALFEGAAEVDCDFECDSLRVSSGGVLRVRGDLTVHKLLDVNHSIDVSGTVRAEDVDVGGRIEAKSLICKRMRVGGKIDVADRLEADSLNVGGKVEVAGTVAIRDFDVGGQASVGGGKISGKIRVGGKFESTSKLEFGDLQVYGRTSLASGSKGTRISTNGVLRVSGDLDCDEVEILGKTEIEGNCKSKKIRVNGSLEVEGSLQTIELLEISGTAEIDHDVEGTNVRVGGRLEAMKVVVSNEIQIAGNAETERGLKGKTVLIERGSRVEGNIVGGLVNVGGSKNVILDWEKGWMGQVAAMRLVGRMTRVEDIYADLVHLGHVSTSERIFARIVELEDGCIAEEISYTEELRGSIERAHIERPPAKVDRLPEPPI